MGRIFVGVNGSTEDSITIAETGILNFTKNYGNSQSETTPKSIPNVTEAISMIEDFEGSDTALGADEYAPGYGSINLYDFELRLTYIQIIDDHDGIGAGDIYLSWVVNELIDDDMFFNHNNNTYIGSYNSGEEGPLDILIFSGNSIFVHLFLELYDEDLLGVHDEFFTSSGYLDLDYSIFTINTSDANIELTLSKTPIRVANAQDYIEAYKPYLYLDDEDGNVPPNMVFGRAIYGDDPIHGSPGVCLQYIYYWEIERTATSEIIHYGDFEEVLIYIDWSSSYSPYRYVFDNGFYFETGEDWRDGQKYKIYDKDRVDLGFYYQNVTFTEELQPFLGTSTQMYYEWRNISEIYDSGVENYCIGNMGLPTIQLTVETSYHAFDVGDASGGVGGLEYFQNYTVDYMSDDIIRALYSTLDLSFNGGILETYQTPVYAPFSFDLCQPFEVPYIINNFPTLLTDAAEFNGAKERNIFNLEFEKNIQVSIVIPYAIEMDFPKTLTPGTPSDLSVDLVLDTDEAIVSLDYLVHLFGNLSLWYFGEQEIDMLMQNTITLDFGANTLKFGDYELNFQDSYTLELDMFDFIEIVHTGSLNFVGNLIDAEIIIKIDEIFKHFFPELGWVVDIFFDEINIVIKSDLTGSIDFNLFVDDDEYNVDVSNSSSQVIPVTITPRSTRNTDDVLSIILNDFTYSMEFDVDWVLEIIYSPILGFFTEELTWDWEIGKWPSFDLFSFQSDSEFTLITYKATAENLWLRQGSINNDPVQIPGFLAFALIFFTGIGIIINFSLINRKKNRFP